MRRFSGEQLKPEFDATLPFGSVTCSAKPSIEKGFIYELLAA